MDVTMEIRGLVLDIVDNLSTDYSLSTETLNKQRDLLKKIRALPTNKQGVELRRCLDDKEYLYKCQALLLLASADPKHPSTKSYISRFLRNNLSSRISLYEKETAIKAILTLPEDLQEKFKNPLLILLKNSRYFGEVSLFAKALLKIDTTETFKSRLSAYLSKRSYIGHNQVIRGEKVLSD
ncbi:MAG: hypothetical protein KDD56_05400 [Bdellovibrionales bacterium]|nr:hypothetical protein [Bdellovibrionales bacterium]